MLFSVFVGIILIAVPKSVRKSSWRRIEVVITRTTRNRLIRKGPWVRIPPSPPRRSKLCIACSDFFYKSERAHAAAPPFSNRTRFAGLRLDEDKTFWKYISTWGTCKQALYRLLRLFYKSERAHAAAPPFPIEPASLGFDWMKTRLLGNIVSTNTPHLR